MKTIKTGLLITLFFISMLSSEAVAGSYWFDGGTLHNANALEWQSASFDNKMATCADFIINLWKDHYLNDSISLKIMDIDDIKPLAAKLVVNLNEAFKPIPDKDQNYKVFVNQRVSQVALMTMSLMGWLKKK